MGVQQGQRVEVKTEGEGDNSLIATVALRERMLEGTAFLIEGTATEGANQLAGADVITVGPAPVEEQAPESSEDDSEGEPPAAPALIVTKREPVSW